MFHYQTLVSITRGRYKKFVRQQKFKKSGITGGHEFELPDIDHSVSDVQDFFKYIIKKHETFTDKSPVKIYVNKVHNRITFKIKTGKFLKFLTNKTIKLLESAERRITKNKNDENVSIINVSTIQELYVHFFQISHSVSH